MKNSGVFATTILSAICVISAPQISVAGAPESNYTIRVTSNMPGDEVRFEVAVIVQNEAAPLQTMTHKTPYEFQATGRAASAMFRARGDSTIRVELVEIRAGKQVSRSTASGRAIVVGNNVAQEVGGFITSF